MNRKRTSSSMRSISCPMSVFEFEFRASQKCISRNLKSASCGPSETSLKSITWSPRAEERADETRDFPLGFITMAEEPVDFRLGLGVTEEATVFLFVLRSPEIDEFPLGSIETFVWERNINFNRGRQMERKMKRIHWMRAIKVKVCVETVPVRREREDLEDERWAKNGMFIDDRRENCVDRDRGRSPNRKIKECKIRNPKRNAK